MVVSFQAALMSSLSIIVLGQYACFLKSTVNLPPVEEPSALAPGLAPVAYLRGGSTIPTIQTQQKRQKPVDIVYGGHGSHPGFLAELQASLKSVLLNAPLDRELRIHFLVDEE